MIYSLPIFSNSVLKAAKRLQSLNLRQDSVELISCPTCGRCQIDLASLVDEVDKLTCHLQKPLPFPHE